MDWAVNSPLMYMYRYNEAKKSRIHQIMREILLWNEAHFPLFLGKKTFIKENKTGEKRREVIKS